MATAVRVMLAGARRVPVVLRLTLGATRAGSKVTTMSEAES